MGSSTDPDAASFSSSSELPRVGRSLPAVNELYPDGYKIITVLRRSFYSGKILLASRSEKSKSAKTSLAIRQYSLENAHHELGLFFKEIWLMKHLKHANLLPYLDSFIAGHNLCIVSPLMDCGSCLDLIHTHFPDGLPEAVVVGVVNDLLQALCYMHSKGYIHRSIRAGHILVSSKGRAVLSGLRDAYCIIDKGRWQRAAFEYPAEPERGLCWLSPEVLQQNLRGYNEKSDIYSLGITTCELANGVPPFIDLASTQLLISKLYGHPPQLWDSTTVPGADRSEAGVDSADVVVRDPDVFDGVTNNLASRLQVACQKTFSRPFHRFTMLCVQFEPSLRPSAVQLTKHPFIQSARKGSLINWEEYLTCVPLLDGSQHEPEQTLSASESYDDVPYHDAEWDFPPTD